MAKRSLSLKITQTSGDPSQTISPESPRRGKMAAEPKLKLTSASLPKASAEQLRTGVMKGYQMAEIAAISQLRRKAIASQNQAQTS